MTENTQQVSESVTARILKVVVFNLIVYVDIGLPMAVIPVFVHSVLHYNTVIAGLAVSIQYFATFASRASAGSRIDRLGPKPVVLWGLVLCGLSGLFLAGAGFMRAGAALSLLLLLISRMILGWAESWASTGVIVWNIRRAGSANTADVISWNGICSYGGIAVGATIGEELSHVPGILGGLTLIGIVSAAMPLIGWAFARRYPAVPPTLGTARPMPFTKVFRLVLPQGSALACGSVGFGAISSCLALYFAAYHWRGAAQALCAFGLVFVAVRFILARQIGRFGGARVATVSLIVEALGLLILAAWSSPEAATVGAAVTGAGFSLVFPALGVVAVERAGPENRGAALGAFSVFLDCAIGLSGPLLGAIIHLGGYGPLFLFSAGVTLIGGAVGVMLAVEDRKARSRRSREA